jgi:hypothetical protein
LQELCLRKISQFCPNSWKISTLLTENPLKISIFWEKSTLLKKIPLKMSEFLKNRYFFNENSPNYKLSSDTCLLYILSFPRYQKIACGDDVSPLAPLVAGVPHSVFLCLLMTWLRFWSFRNTTCMLTICKFIIAGQKKCFLNVFVRLTVICLGFLNSLLPILWS